MLQSENVKIVLRFTYRNHLGEVNDFAHEFLSIHDLKNYLSSESERAVLIGYKKLDKKLLNARSSNVKLCVRAGSHEEVFNDVFEFADYLKKNKSIAGRLQFN